MIPDNAPEKAHELLNGTTPGPWGVDHDHAWEPGVWSPDGIVFGPYYDREDMEQWEAGSDADLRLAAAAPTLAAIVAGLREEWGIEERHEYTGEWHWHSTYPDHESAHSAVNGMSHFRVARRYVTEPEKIK